MHTRQEYGKTDSTAASTTTALAPETMHPDEGDKSTAGCFGFCRALGKLCRWKRRSKAPAKGKETTTDITPSVEEEPKPAIILPSAEQVKHDTLEPQQPEDNACQQHTDMAGHAAVHPAPHPTCPQPAKSAASAPKPCPLPREHVARLTVPLPLAQRRLVVGPRGETRRRLQAAYGGVQITVPPPEDRKAKGVTLRGPRGQVEAAAKAIKTILQEADAKRQQDRKQEVVLAVPPDKRRHVVGRGGQALHAILQQYQEVSVTVPPPQDTTARGITLLGPKDDVAAAAAAISRHLEVVEARLQEDRREKKRKGKDRVKISVPVAPSERRLLVGHKGEALQRLLQQCEGVRVSVPPHKDTTTQHVTLHGPKDKVDAAAAAVRRRIEEERQREERRKNGARAAKTTTAIQQAPRHCRPITLAHFLPSMPRGKNQEMRKGKPQILKDNTDKEDADHANSNTPYAKRVDTDSLAEEHLDRTHNETLKAEQVVTDRLQPQKSKENAAQEQAVRMDSDSLVQEHFDTTYSEILKAQTKKQLAAVHPAPQPTCPQPAKSAASVPKPCPLPREHVARLTVPLPLAQRRLVVGPRGETRRRLQAAYGGVQISVPPPEDRKAKGVTLRGPRGQVEAAANAIKTILQEADAKWQQDRKKGKDRVKISVAVAPSERRLLVGHKGEALQRLLQQCEGVRVTVPPHTDTTTQHVTLHGPKDKVDAAATAIRRLTEEQRQMKDRTKNRARTARTQRATRRR